MLTLFQLIEWLKVFQMQLLLMVGAKLEYIMSSLALDVSEKRSRAEEAVITPSDELFWFHRPGIVLQLIHFILFQNSFEIAFFFWILVLPSQPSANAEISV